MRAEAGGATPTRRVPRNRRPPTDPLTPTSALSVDAVRHAAMASVSASAASDAGVPGPEGSFTSGPAHDTLEMTTAAARKNSPPRRTRRTQRKNLNDLILRVPRVLCGGEFTAVVESSLL